MSISAAGAGAGLNDDGLVARLGATQLVADTPAIIVSALGTGVGQVITCIDVFSDGSATGDVTAQIVIGGTPLQFWNDTFGASTQGSRHYRGLKVVRPGESVELFTSVNGACFVDGFVVPYHAGQAYGL
jgi:hypothetical protein